MATEQKDVEKGLKDEEQKPPVVEESSISTNDSLKKEKNHFLRDALYFSINPTGTFYYYWTLAVSVACFYNLTTLSLVVFEDFRVYLFSYWLVGNGLADAINVADVFINSRRQFLDEGVIVSDVWSMFVIYIRHLYSWLDVLAILPTDLLLFVRPHVSLFRLNRFLKIYRMLEFVGMTEVRTIYPNLFRLYRLVFICFIIFHWNACVYFFISTFYDIDEAVHDDWEFSYEKIPDPAYFDPKNYSKMCPMLTLSCPVLDEDYVSKEFVEIGTELWFPNFVKQYSLSFYWSACTLVTLGEQPSPTHSAQMLFEICDTLLGLVIFAVIVGDVGNMVQKMNAQRSDFDEKLDGCKQHMSYRQVNSILQHRIVNWFTFMWADGQAKVDEKNMADFLPNRLHGQLAVEVHMATLSKVKLFENCDSGLLYEIILKLNLQVFSPSDYVCKKGDIGKEMYIIHHGQLEVVSEDGKKVFVTLTEGSVFGELSILNIPGNKNGNHRTASIRSVGYAHLYVLTKDDLWDVIHDYPNAKEALMEKGRQLLRNTNHLDESKAFPGPRIDESYRTVEEKFKGLNVVMDALMEQMEELEKTFYSDSMQMKQQVTDLEHTFVKKLSPIKAMRFGLVSVIMPEGITDKSQFLIPETRFES